MCKLTVGTHEGGLKGTFPLVPFHAGRRNSKVCFLNEVETLYSLGAEGCGAAGAGRTAKTLSPLKSACGVSGDSRMDALG